MTLEQAIEGLNNARITLRVTKKRLRALDLSTELISEHIKQLDELLNPEPSKTKYIIEAKDVKGGWFPSGIGLGVPYDTYEEAQVAIREHKRVTGSRIHRRVSPIEIKPAPVKLVQESWKSDGQLV